MRSECKRVRTDRYALAPHGGRHRVPVCIDEQIIRSIHVVLGCRHACTGGVVDGFIRGIRLTGHVEVGDVVSAVGEVFGDSVSARSGYVQSIGEDSGGLG